MNLKTIILQKLDSLNASMEFKACLTFALIQDVKVVRVEYSDLESHIDLLKDSTTLPVGSVEFLVKAFILAGKTIPNPLSYPSCFLPYMVQSPELFRREDIQRNDVFIKPFFTKLFTGFCLNNVNDDNQHDYETYLSLGPSEPIWVSPVLEIDQEWRVYIQNNKIVGYARYDDADSEDIDPLEFSKVLLTHSDISHPYCLDVGRLKDGRWTLIEANDAWAIGLYGRALTPAQYVSFLYDRWETC